MWIVHFTMDLQIFIAASNIILPSCNTLCLTSLQRLQIMQAFGILSSTSPNPYYFVLFRRKVTYRSTLSLYSCLLKKKTLSIMNPFSCAIIEHNAYSLVYLLHLPLLDNFQNFCLKNCQFSYRLRVSCFLASISFFIW